MTEARGLKRLALALRRRRTVVLCVGVGTLCAGSLIVAAVPAQYRAEAAVKVIDARPPAEYVQPSFTTPPVSDIVGERMKALRLHVLNRPLLMRVAQDTGLLGKHKGDEKSTLEDMRDHFEFRVDGADTFMVAYTDTNPARAEAVVNRLAQLFMDEENEEIQGRADSTTRVLEDSAKKLRGDLDAADRKISDFKRQHYGSLPEQQEETLRNLDQTQMEINVTETALQSAQDRRRHLLEGDISPLRHSEDELSSRLSAARATYTETHPEVQRLSQEYAKVRTARLEDEKRLRQQTLSENPEMLSVNTEINQLRGNLGRLRTKQEMLRTRVDGVAKNAELLGGMTIDRDVLKDKYQSLQAKAREAEVSGRLAHDFRQYRFNVLEPAVRPAHPSAPNRPLLAVAVLVVAALAGLGSGIGLETIDPTVRDATDIEQVTPDVPVLASIPRIGGGRTRRAS